MFYLVDWLSFSLDVEITNEQKSETQLSVIHERLFSVIGSVILGVLNWGAAEYANGRPPHAYSLRVQRTGLAVFVAPQHGRILVEVSGTGCRILDDNGSMRPLLASVHQFMSRIDLAVDIVTEAKPREFVSSGHNGRFTSGGNFYSKSGETEYVGSRKSDRYARVYRYTKPHAREKFLRVEMVMKRGYSRLYAQRVIQEGIKPSIAHAGEDFGWQSTLWDVENAAPSELKLARKARSNDKTLRWLEDAVVPSFLKLVRSGGLEDWEDWLVENLVDPLRKS